MSSKIGMLWFDNDGKSTLEARIQRAIDYYHKKYGRMVGEIHVHPMDLSKEKNLCGVLVKPDEHILPFHFFVIPATVQEGR